MRPAALFLPALLAACSTPRAEPVAPVEAPAGLVAELPLPPLPAAGRPRRSDRFADVELVTHDERKVRFRTDLVRDKTVLVNFMYTSCTGV